MESLETYKKQLKQKMLANEKLSCHEKGLSEDGIIIADYPVLEKILDSGAIDPNGRIDNGGNIILLQKKQKQLQKAYPFAKTIIRYLPIRAIVYKQCCKELGVRPSKS